MALPSTGVIDKVPDEAQPVPQQPVADPTAEEEDELAAMMAL